MATDDVSPERSLAESTTLEELRRRERELADFIENASVGLHWVGADGTILWANQAELDLLGYKHEEYIGCKINEFHADRDVISDIGMLGEDGYELIRKVGALPAGRGGKVPAIALTAYARTEDRLRALRAGYQMHISKPVELAELVAVVASPVGRGDRAE